MDLERLSQTPYCLLEMSHPDESLVMCLMRDCVKFYSLRRAGHLAQFLTIISLNGALRLDFGRYTV